MKQALLVLVFFLGSHCFGQRPACGTSIDSLIGLGSKIVFSHTDSSLHYFNQSLALAKQCNDSLGLVKSETFIGLYQSLNGNYEAALAKYFYALEIATRNGFKKDIGIIKNNIGVEYFDLDEPEKARQYYEESLVIMIDLQDTVWLSRVYGNIAGVYFKEGNYDQSIYTLEQSILYARLSEKYEAMGSAMANLAMVKIAIGEVESAFESFDEGIHLLDSIGVKKGVAITLVEKGESLKSHGRLDEALQAYQNGLDYALEASRPVTIERALKGIIDVYSLKDNYKSAFEFFQKYLDFKDSLLTSEKYEIALELDEKYQNKEKAQRISFLEEQEALNKEIVNQQRTVTIVLVILVAVLFMFFGLALILWIRKKKTNAILAQQNEKIEQSLKDKEVLIREVHHRVKNNLQIVSGMLNIQANSGVDEATKLALLENRKRVQSMAIVHQKLYQSDKVGEVALNEYLNHLIDEIELQNDEEWKVSRNIVTVSASIDATINLGLILTEALYNCYKHAFTNQAHPAIKVELIKQHSKLELIVSDNGIGFDPNAIASDSFGLKLIRSLSKSLDADCNWQVDSGTLFTLSFDYE